MAKTCLCVGFTGSISAGVSRYIALGAGYVAATGSESAVQNTFRSAGTLTNLLVKIYANTANGISTARVRKNLANGNGNVSIPAATTGLFEDTSNSDTVSVGDELDYYFVAGGSSGSISISAISNIYDASADTVIRSIACSTSAISLSSSTIYSVHGGRRSSAVTTEANVRFDHNSAGTYKNMLANVSANTRATTTTMRLRKNGANGNLVISITALTTGIFEDLVNTDAVAANDDTCFALTLGAEVTSITIGIMAIDFVSVVNRLHYIGGIDDGRTVNFGVTEYYSFVGYGASATENDIAFRSGINETYTNLYFYISANTVNNGSTLYLRKNGVNTAVTISIPSSTTGAFEDSSNNSSFSTGNARSYGLIIGGTSGSLIWHTIGMMGLSVLDPLVVTPAEISAVGATVNPSVVLGNIVNTPNPVSAIGSVVNPITIQGSIIIIPSAISGIGATVNPLVIQSSLIIIPAAIHSIGSVVNPSIVMGSLIIIPTAISAIGSVVDPNVIAGGNIIITPDAISTLGATVNPVIILGNILISPSAASGIAGIVNPTIILGNIIIIPASIEVIGSTADPTVIMTGLIISPVSVSSIGEVVDPIVSLGTITITPTAITAIGSIIDPSIILSNVNITPAAIGAIGAIVDPTVIAGIQKFLMIEKMFAKGVASD